MPKYTTNYNLTKAEGSDPANFLASNANWDKVDETLKSHEDDLKDLTSIPAEVEEIKRVLANANTELGIVEVQEIKRGDSPLGFDYFIGVYNDPDYRSSRTAVFSIDAIESELNLRASNTRFADNGSSKGIVFNSYTLSWYWGDGWQLDSTSVYVDIGTGAVIRNNITWTKIYGCKINPTPS